MTQGAYPHAITQTDRGTHRAISFADTQNTWGTEQEHRTHHTTTSALPIPTMGDRMACAIISTRR